jgi:hypothetical protein
VLRQQRRDGLVQMRTRARIGEQDHADVLAGFHVEGVVGHRAVNAIRELRPFVVRPLSRRAASPPPLHEHLSNTAPCRHHEPTLVGTVVREQPPSQGALDRVDLLLATEQGEVGFRVDVRRRERWLLVPSPRHAPPTIAGVRSRPGENLLRALTAALLPRFGGESKAAATDRAPTPQAAIVPARIRS